MDLKHKYDRDGSMSEDQDVVQNTVELDALSKAIVETAGDTRDDQLIAATVISRVDLHKEALRLHRRLTRAETTVAFLMPMDHLSSMVSGVGFLLIGAALDNYINGKKDFYAVLSCVGVLCLIFWGCYRHWLNKKMKDEKVEDPT